MTSHSSKSSLREVCLEHFPTHFRFSAQYLSQYPCSVIFISPTQSKAIFPGSHRYGDALKTSIDTYVFIECRRWFEVAINLTFNRKSSGMPVSMCLDEWAQRWLINIGWCAHPMVLIRWHCWLLKEGAADSKFCICYMRKHYGVGA